ncbi:hypothetical protein [Ilumatobacter coccineus]|uniref:LTD domain-containing protein n=1 Tax=Ilumatobacter coccineus (strain NBRC 103263 / KCTC 29153 / YM16-304) TaxID=1313172 RepID=A0A6C7E6S6_ILUCY|nr:hypothetical protein [Ilumatobacter coccineus]BAN00318.1 hypothetical protein YM304_00040 [Ilumatobacter coccineus YM16-304]
MKLRSLAAGTTLLIAGTAIGATTQHFASAGVSSGERAVLVPIEPCRLADTRPAPNTVGPRSIGLGPADTHTIDAQQAGTPCSGSIPTDASALSLNITALGATEQSYLTVWAGGDRPTAASLNPAPGQPPVPNAVVTELSVDQEFEIYNNSGTVSVVVDVNGYYVDHDHDDRYVKLPTTEVFVGGADFTPAATEDGGAGFDYKNLLWLRSPGSGRDCLLAPLPLQPGTSVSSVDVRYNAATDVDVDVQVVSSSRSATSADPIDEFLALHLFHDGQPFAATGSEEEISMVNVVSGTLPTGRTIRPVTSDHHTALELCTSGGVAIVSATVHLD